MSEEVKNTGYGYASDEISALNIQFGLNAGVATLAKFEWINNAGKDGAEAEALDIQFAIAGSDRPLNNRLFPVNEVFTKDGRTSDPAAPEFQKAVKDLNAVVNHILRCYNTEDTIKAAFSVPIANFKEFCKIAMSLIPKGHDKIALDIFCHYQWEIREGADKTYLVLPKKMTSGKWLCQAITPVGSWKPVIHPNPDSNTPVALKYVDDAGNVHPFIRNGFFMNSNWAKQQTKESASIPEEGGAAAGTGEQKSAW